MEEKSTLFNSQMNQVSLNPPPPVSLYFVPGEGHGASVNMAAQRFTPSGNSFLTVDSIVRISKCKSLNPFTLQLPVTASIYPCAAFDFIFL